MCLSDSMGKAHSKLFSQLESTDSKIIDKGLQALIDALSHPSRSKGLDVSLCVSILWRHIAGRKGEICPQDIFSIICFGVAFIFDNNLKNAKGPEVLKFCQESADAMIPELLPFLFDMRDVYYFCSRKVFDAVRNASGFGHRYRDRLIPSAGRCSATIRDLCSPLKYADTGVTTGSSVAGSLDPQIVRTFLACLEEMCVEHPELSLETVQRMLQFRLPKRQVMIGFLMTVLRYLAGAVSQEEGNVFRNCCILPTRAAILSRSVQRIVGEFINANTKFMSDDVEGIVEAAIKVLDFVLAGFDDLLPVCTMLLDGQAFLPDMKHRMMLCSTLQRCLQLMTAVPRGLTSALMDMMWVEIPALEQRMEDRLQQSGGREDTVTGTGNASSQAAETMALSLQVAYLHTLELAVGKASSGGLAAVSSSLCQFLGFICVFMSADVSAMFSSLIDRLGGDLASNVWRWFLHYLKFVLTVPFAESFWQSGSLPLKLAMSHNPSSLEHLAIDADQPLSFSLRRHFEATAVPSPVPSSASSSTATVPTSVESTPGASDPDRSLAVANALDELIVSRIERMLRVLIGGLTETEQLEQLLHMAVDPRYELSQLLRGPIETALVRSLVDVVRHMRNDPRLQQKDDVIRNLEGELDRLKKQIADLGKELAHVRATSDGQRREYAELRDSFLCPICLDSFISRQPAALTDCGHVFCASCLEEFLVREGGGRFCPMCKRQIVSARKMVRLQGL